MTASTHDPVALESVTFAGFWRRLAAMFIDWTIFYIGATIFYIGASLTFMLIAPSPSLFIIGFPLLSLTLLTWLWTRTQSPGMRVLKYRLVDVATGGTPRVRRMLPRVGGALLLYASVVAWSVVGTWFAFSASSAEKALVVVGMVLVVGVLEIVAYLWMLQDRRRQTLIDKWCGVMAIHEQR